jgi:hypothetical protein
VPRVALERLAAGGNLIFSAFGHRVRSDYSTRRAGVSEDQ